MRRSHPDPNLSFLARARAAVAERSDVSHSVGAYFVGRAVDIDRFDVETDKSGLRREPGFVVEFHRVVADSHHEIGLLVRKANHVTQRMEKYTGIARIVLEDFLGHGCKHHRQSVLVCQLGNLGLQTCTDGTKADGEKWLFCLFEELNHVVENVRFCGRRPRRPVEGNTFIVGLLRRQADWKPYMHRTRAAAERNQCGFEKDRLHLIGLQTGRSVGQKVLDDRCPFGWCDHASVPAFRR